MLRSNTEVPFVAEISEFYTVKNKKMFKAVWFYRPGDIVQNEIEEFSPDEVIYSDHMDSHNLNTIISRCDVLPKLTNDPFEDYIREKIPQTLYVCETFYQSQTGNELFLIFKETYTPPHPRNYPFVR